MRGFNKKEIARAAKKALVAPKGKTNAAEKKLVDEFINQSLKVFGL